MSSQLIAPPLITPSKLKEQGEKKMYLTWRVMEGLKKTHTQWCRFVNGCYTVCAVNAFLSCLLINE